MSLEIHPIESNTIEELNYRVNVCGFKGSCYAVGYYNPQHADNLLKKIGLRLTALISDDKIALLRGGEKVLNEIKSLLETSSFPKVSFENLKNVSTENIIIFVAHSGGDKGYEKAVEYINTLGLGENINVTIYSGESLNKHSAVINGKIKILNVTQYNKSWPWYFDIIFSDKTNAELKEIKTHYPLPVSIYSNGTSYVYHDYERKCFNFTNGERLVTNSKPDSPNKIIFIGDSRIYGELLTDEDTIPSCVQKYFNERGLACNVRNSAHHGMTFVHAMHKLKNISLDKNTIICCSINLDGIFKGNEADLVQTERYLYVCYAIKKIHDYCLARNARFVFVNCGNIFDIHNPSHIEQFILDAVGMPARENTYWNNINKYCIANDVKFVDLTYIYNKKKRISYMRDWNHFSSEGAKAIGQELGEYFMHMLVLVNAEKKKRIDNYITKLYCQIGNEIIEKFETPKLLSYLNSLKELANGKPSNSGVIVMNCNPFTLGHRYLIETARAQVEQLYILVVEEDKSAFKFKDRFEMIRLGVADIPNVEVMPSGEFVISTITFPEYFDKDAKQSEKIDPSFDVEIFCNKIAPALGCTKRFVGEEPLDLVTNQYNQKMAEILPKHGMELVVIPRKEQGDAPISASRVRKLMSEGRYNELAQLVPATTYDYLIAMQPQP